MNIENMAIGCETFTKINHNFLWVCSHVIYGDGVGSSGGGGGGGCSGGCDGCGGMMEMVVVIEVVVVM